MLEVIRRWYLERYGEEAQLVWMPIAGDRTVVTVKEIRAEYTFKLVWQLDNLVDATLIGVKWPTRSE